MSERFAYVQIADTLWEVWDGPDLVCYQMGGPTEPCLIVAPEVFEQMLERA